MNKNILIVEDNEISYRLAEYILTQNGYQVVWACNGKECLEQITRHDYICILMDVHMPELDGIEATKIIRQTFSKEMLPIIGVTAEDVQTELDMLIQCGMDGHLTKPYQIDSLLMVIQDILKKREIRHSAFSRNSDNTESPISTDIEWLNADKILARSQGNIALLKKTAPLYGKATEKILSSIEQSLSTNDKQGLHNHLHQLKGVVGCFTIEGPFRRLKVMERFAERNETNKIQAQLPVLMKEIQVLKKYLEYLVNKDFKR